MQRIDVDSLLLQSNHHIQEGQHESAAAILNVGLMWHPRNPLLIKALGQLERGYDATFYDSASEGSLRSARIILRHLQSFANFSSLVDVGAGAGAWSQAALELGKDVLSIDGNWVKEVERKHPGLTFEYHDLNVTVECKRTFDVAVCVEVAEHLIPTRSYSFVTDLCNLAPVVIFGAALPRQGGIGHINCRPSSFWIDLFARHHFTALDAFRPTFWYDGRVEPWYAQNAFLFVANTRLSEFASIPRPSLVDVYHPRVVLDSPMCLQDHLNGTPDPVTG
ncbi:MAG: hypothetical protein RIR70_468 [Pseudomonadota bacterium]|jgi:hypothetical protein